MFKQAWSPDGRRLAFSGFDRDVKIWSIASPDQPRVFKWPQGNKWTGGLSWSPDGTRLVAGGWDQIIRVWDVARGTEVLSMIGHSGAIRSLCWSPDGRRIASAGFDGNVKLWDAGIGEFITDPAGDFQLGSESGGYLPGQDMVSLRVTDDGVNIYFLYEFVGDPVTYVRRRSNGLIYQAWKIYLHLDVDADSNTGCGSAGTEIRISLAPPAHDGLPLIQWGRSVISIFDPETCTSSGSIIDAPVGGHFIEVSVPIATLANVYPNKCFHDFTISTGNDRSTPTVYSIGVACDPNTLIEDLIDAVLDLNLLQGIENSLDVKLDAVLQALADLSENNDVAACNALDAFINAVQAQSGKQIETGDAAFLIAAAHHIKDHLRCDE